MSDIHDMLDQALATWVRHHWPKVVVRHVRITDEGEVVRAEPGEGTEPALYVITDAGDESYAVDREIMRDWVRPPDAITEDTLEHIASSLNWALDKLRHEHGHEK